MDAPAWDWPPPPDEIEVLRLHMVGLPDRAIGRQLGISETTVRRAAARARARGALPTRAAVIAVLVAEGRLDPPDRPV